MPLPLVGYPVALTSMCASCGTQGRSARQRAYTYTSNDGERTATATATSLAQRAEGTGAVHRRRADPSSLVYW
jgi:hypothetical protein